MGKAIQYGICAFFMIYISFMADLFYVDSEDQYQIGDRLKCRAYSSALR